MHTSPTVLPQLPLFPLQTVLFPDGRLPLRIFEVRYLDMIGRCHQAGEPFGVVCLSEGSEVSRPAATGGAAPGGDGYKPETFHPVGTLARITRLERPQAGLMMIECLGTQRFRLLHSARRQYGLWVGEAELLGDEPAQPVPDDLAFTRQAIQDVVRNVERSGESGVELPLRAPYRWDDCGWLANRWCELLPLPAAQKQNLMALDSPVLRLELVADVLAQMGVTAPRPE
jgi:uncharacterized protein